MFITVYWSPIMVNKTLAASQWAAVGMERIIKTELNTVRGLNFILIMHQILLASILNSFPLTMRYLIALSFKTTMTNRDDHK